MDSTATHLSMINDMDGDERITDNPMPKVIKGRVQ